MVESIFVCEMQDKSMASSLSLYICVRKLLESSVDWCVGHQLIGGMKEHDFLHYLEEWRLSEILYAKICKSTSTSNLHQGKANHIVQLLYSTKKYTFRQFRKHLSMVQIRLCLCEHNGCVCVIESIFM